MSNNFSLMIERIKRETGLTYLEVIIGYCEENLVDFEDVAKVIHPSLRSKIRVESVKVNLMKDNDPDIPIWGPDA